MTGKISIQQGKIAERSKNSKHGELEDSEREERIKENSNVLIVAGPST